jgi:hypothetical protein
VKLSAHPVTSSASASSTASGPVLDLRDLSVEELKLDALYRPVVAEARSRFALFRILDQNYQDWSNCLAALISPLPLDESAARLNLDRLLLNYFTCAFHLRQHFETLFQQRLRTDDSSQKKYKMLVDQLCQTSWPFAFFLDFRHYLNHEGLAIGFYKRKLSPTSVSLELTLNSVELLQATKDWPRSRLTAAKGLIEIAPLLRDLHAQLQQNYAAIVVKTFFADLLPAAEFYKKLAAEVRLAHPACLMALRDPASGSAAEPRLLFAPNDLFADLGLAAIKL